jgi:hypothetical protein
MRCTGLQIEGGNKMLILAVLPKVTNVVVTSLHGTNSACTLYALLVAIDMCMQWP